MIEYIAIGLGILNLIFLIIILVKLAKPKEKEDFKDISGDIYKSANQLYQLISKSLDANQKNSDRNLEFQRERLVNLDVNLHQISKALEDKMEVLRKNLDEDVKFMNESNLKSIEIMRQTVDEKLSDTLEKRLNKSFELISSRLEAVYKGIGEVAGLASSVSDIKKVLTNVRMRGTWGEVQLNALLEQMLAPSQFEKNVQIDAKSGERVDFAVVLPGRDEGKVYLPIDSKFPLEEYQRLLTAYEDGDKIAFEKSKKGLEQRIKDEADSISAKYILPPLTTDFAVMYFPIEGLYAEALRNDNLGTYLHNKKIMICGPTNLGALLNSLQTGFKTLSIEKRSVELWGLLSAFKMEFSKFYELLLKTQKKLQEASDVVDFATKRSQKIERKLSGVKEIEDSDSLLDD